MGKKKFVIIGNVLGDSDQWYTINNNKNLYKDAWCEVMLRLIRCRPHTIQEIYRGSKSYTDWGILIVCFLYPSKTEAVDKKVNI